MDNFAIRCEGLSKQYGDVNALQPLDLTVPHGAIFGFLGRNGAGKTTTIRLLTGLAVPSSGRAWVAGVETTTADSAARASFGYLPQEPAFYGWMNATEYLDYVGKLCQLDKPTRQRRIDEMLTLVKLTDAAKRPIRGFSGGMMQRLGIAQALLHEPDILIMDEWLSTGDEHFRDKANRRLAEMVDETNILVLASHSRDLIAVNCSRVIWLEHGKVIMDGPSADVLAAYFDPPHRPPEPATANAGDG